MVLAVGKSRPNGTQLRGVVRGPGGVAGGDGGEGGAQTPAPFLPFLQEVKSRKVCFKMRKTGAPFNAGGKEGGHGEGKVADSGEKALVKRRSPGQQDWTGLRAERGFQGKSLSSWPCLPPAPWRKAAETPSSFASQVTFPIPQVAGRPVPYTNRHCSLRCSDCFPPQPRSSLSAGPKRQHVEAANDVFHKYLYSVSGTVLDTGDTARRQSAVRLSGGRETRK